MVTWSDNEVLQLISFWGEEGVQAQLEGSKRNKHVYEKISKTLARNGIHKSSDQCRAKMKKLKTDYRKVKDKNGKTGRGRSIWKYFDALDAILGHRPATKPPLLLDTAAEEMIVASTIITTEDAGESEEESPVDDGSSSTTTTTTTTTEGDDKLSSQANQKYYQLESGNDLQRKLRRRR